MPARKGKNNKSFNAWDIFIILLVSLNALIFLSAIVALAFLAPSLANNSAGILAIGLLFFAFGLYIWLPLSIITLIVMPLYLVLKRPIGKMKWLSFLAIALSVIFLWNWLSPYINLEEEVDSTIIDSVEAHRLINECSVVSISRDDKIVIELKQPNLAPSQATSLAYFRYVEDVASFEDLKQTAESAEQKCGEVSINN